jgi:two-component system chemotaxis sensor kinase CheA
MTNEEIQQIFFVECEESLAAAEAGLAACKAGTQDDDTINGVFRAVHSVKGGAGAFGFVALQAYAHTFETLLSDVRDGSVALDESDVRPAAACARRAQRSCQRGPRRHGDAPDDAPLIAE